ncbi:MAG: family 10 glycosylhydrolase [Duncaniella sp.]|nr:family 10 glycosylhydrolase [Duncaniella sp.]
MTRLIIALLAAVVCALPSTLLAENPKREMRGVWVATAWGIDWPSKQGTDAATTRQQRKELAAIADRCRDLELTTVFFQVRPMADAFYESSSEPWSSYLTGKRGAEPSFDPLEEMVNLCHERGLEIYAWVNPFRWSAGADWTGERDRRWKQNGWLLNYGKYTVFNPGLEAARQHVVDVCREIVTGYDVDGLIWDDYFYPNKMPEGPGSADYDLYIKEAPHMTHGDWRRANVHKTVADVSAMVRDERPGIRFGISPAGVAGKADTSADKWEAGALRVKAADWQYNDIYSDPLGWLYQGTIDFISPQIYWSSTHSTAPYVEIADWWSKTAPEYGIHFYSSMTMERIEKGDVAANCREIVSQVAHNRRLSRDGAPGSVLYSAKFLPRMAPYLKDLYSTPALVPSLGEADEPVAEPRGIVRKADRLSWGSADIDRRDCERYTVYAIPPGVSDPSASDGDGLDGRYLLATVYDTSFTLPQRVRGDGWSYAVCTLSGHGHESRPVIVR